MRPRNSSAWHTCAIAWLSLDGTSYSQVGTINAPARQGVLTANLASYSGSNPDTTDTLAVNLAESGGVLSSGSAADAALGNTLCIVDSELLSYETATLTSASHYSLTTLYRGFYGTAIASHSSGAQFARLDNAVFKFNLPPQYIGVELYIKLQSFNVFGGGIEALSSCMAYTYTPTGAAVDHPVARAWMTGAPMDMGSVTGTVGPEDDFGTPFTLTIELDVDLGTA